MKFLHIEATAQTEWRQHWTRVFAATVGMAMASVPPYIVGVMMLPLEREFGWSRAGIAFGPSMISFAAVIFAPFLGAAIDRVGPRRIGVAGVVAVNLAVAMLALARPAIWSWWALWVVVSLTALLVKPVVWLAAVLSFFSRGRGLALAITLCGTAGGSALTPLIATSLTLHYGWRIGFVGTGIFWALISVPVVALMFTSRLDQARKPEHRESLTPAAEPAGLSARSALVSWRYLQIMIGALAMSFGTIVFMLNLVPILEGSGHAAGLAAGLASLGGISAIFGRLISGQLIDHFKGNRVAAAGLALPALAAAMLLWSPESTIWAGAAAITLGFSLGAEMDAVAYLVSRHFGLRSFGFLFATINGFQSLTSGLASPAINAIYDSTHSYRAGLWMFLLVSVAGILVFLFLRDPQDDERILSC